MAQATCAIDGCESPVSARGWCGKHYYRWTHYGDPLKLPSRARVNQGTCSITGCSRPAFSRTWCNTHYARWHRWGNPEHQPLGGVADHEAHLWAQVTGSDPLGCWEWHGSLDRGGYGLMTVGPRSWRVHRFVYTLLIGDIPTGRSGKPLPLDHTCHTADAGCREGSDCLHRRCVNPWHLEPVTTLVNHRRSRASSGDIACPRGHLWAHNTRIDKGGYRHCISCARNRNREARRRIRLAS